MFLKMPNPSSQLASIGVGSVFRYITTPSLHRHHLHLFPQSPIQYYTGRDVTLYRRCNGIFKWSEAKEMIETKYESRNAFRRTCNAGPTLHTRAM